VNNKFFILFFVFSYQLAAVCSEKSVVPYRTLTEEEKLNTNLISEYCSTVINGSRDKKVSLLTPCRPCMGAAFAGLDIHGNPLTAIFHIVPNSDINDLIASLTNTFSQPHNIKMIAFSQHLDKKIFDEDYYPAIHQSQDQWFISVAKAVKKELNMPGTNFRLIQSKNPTKDPAACSIIVGNQLTEDGFPTMNRCDPREILPKKILTLYFDYLSERYDRIVKTSTPGPFGVPFFPFISAHQGLSILVSLQSQKINLFLFLAQQLQRLEEENYIFGEEEESSD
jgi:hypothetical protein